MAILKVYAIRDAATDSYQRLLCSISRGEMVRSFIDVCNDPNAPFQKHPNDYLLFELGEWDSQSGDFKQYKTPVMLGSANDFLHKQKSNTVPAAVLREEVPNFEYKPELSKASGT